MIGYLKGKNFNKKVLTTNKFLKNKENRGGGIANFKIPLSFIFIAHVWDNPIRVFFYT
jgi:hypothetical protein